MMLSVRMPLSGVAMLCLVLTAWWLPAVGADSLGLVKLNKFNHDENVRQGTWFIKLYAPWCVHCQSLAPVWEKLADHSVAEDWPVKIAEVDCTAAPAVCSKAKVAGYPTLLLLRDGVAMGTYNGPASVSSFESWLKARYVLDRAAGAPTVTQAYSLALRRFLGQFPTSNVILNLWLFAIAGVSMATVAFVQVFNKFSPDLGRPTSSVAADGHKTD